MQEIKCMLDHAEGIRETLINELQLKLPDVYQKQDGMVILAKEMKKYTKTAFCTLPFCHTIEAEAMGGQIQFGNGTAGPRGREYLVESVQELLGLPPMNLKSKRIQELWMAIHTLRKQGEHVVLQVSGPFTIMSVLIDLKHVFRTLLKEPEVMQQLYAKFQTELITYIEEACNHGVELISYADSAASVNILGPKRAAQMAGEFTYPFLKQAEMVTKNKALMILCPQTTELVSRIGKLDFFDIRLPVPMDYGEACIAVIRKTGFTGQMCIKNASYKLHNGIIKGIRLRGDTESISIKKENVRGKIWIQKKHY